MQVVFRILIAIGIYIPCLGLGSNLRFEHLTVEHGLSEGGVHAILQDSQGFMWFGTRFGLNRYDGINIKVFIHDPLNPESPPGHWANVLFEDSQETLWVGSMTNGVGRYDRRMEVFHNYRFDPRDNSSISNNFITDIFEDSEGTLWIGTRNGLNRWIPEKESFIHYHHTVEDTHSIRDNYISALAELPGKVLLIGHGNGSLSMLNLITGQIQHDHSEIFQPSKTSDRAIKTILVDPDSNFVWLSRFGYGLVKYGLEEGVLDSFHLPGLSDEAIAANFIFSFSMDQHRKLWMGTASGITIFDTNSKTFSYHPHDEKDPYSVSDQIIFAVYVDAHGIVWTGSDGKGVNIHKPGQLRFDLFKHDPDDARTPSANSIYTLDEDAGGDIWFTTMPGGVNRYHPEQGTFRVYETLNQRPRGWSIRYAQSLLIDHEGKLWVGSAAAGLMVIDPETGLREKLFYPRANDPRSLASHTVFNLLETQAGVIWAGTGEDGLSRYNRETNDFTTFRHDPDDPGSISGNRIYSLFEDASGVLWIGTSDGGLCRWDQASERFTQYRAQGPGSNSPTSDCILDINEDAEQTLWIGTRNGGLNKLDPERTHFSTLDLGLDHLNLSINSIELDERGFLWLSTNQGLIKADREEGLLNQYGRADGLQGMEFYRGSNLKDSRGYIYFGGPYGFNRFHPDSIRNNPHVPPVYITSLSVNYEPVPIGMMPDGRSLLSESILSTEQLTLEHQDRVVSFEFAALDFTDPSRNRYEYKLEGFDPEWISANGQQRAQYMNLPPGKFEFKVRGSNNDGVWNSAGASLAVLVLPPFWKTSWFRIVLGLSILALILIYVHLRVKYLEEQRRQLEQLVVERTQDLKLEIQERQAVEKAKATQEIDHLKRELLTQSLHLNDKQQMMEEIRSEVEKFHKLDPEAIKQRTSKLINHLKRRTENREGWQEFEKWFTEIHTGFFTNLRQSFPDLSENELKVCALLRVNMISKDIAKVLNVQAASIDIYRHRIRKKMNLPSEENLTTTLSRF